jgi:hypothetical protein
MMPNAAKRIRLAQAARMSRHKFFLSKWRKVGICSPTTLLASADEVIE